MRVTDEINRRCLGRRRQDLPRGVLKF